MLANSTTQAYGHECFSWNCGSPTTDRCSPLLELPRDGIQEPYRDVVANRVHRLIANRKALRAETRPNGISIKVCGPFPLLGLNEQCLMFIQFSRTMQSAPSLNTRSYHASVNELVQHHRLSCLSFSTSGSPITDYSPRQLQTNCTDRTNGFDSIRWGAIAPGLNLSAWLRDRQARTPVCTSSTQHGGCCKPSELWAICFVGLGNQRADHEGLLCHQQGLCFPNQAR